MKLYPESALVQLEFDKVKTLLAGHCKTEFAKAKAESLRIHTSREYIELELQQTHEFKLILQNGLYFPNDLELNLSKELKLLGIPGAVLTGEQFMRIRRLAEDMRSIFRWFDPERRKTYPGLTKVISDTYYEKAIIEMIEGILDEQGYVKDKASNELTHIRINLNRKRNELRRVVDRVLSRLNKSGYVADIEESFLNGRRVVAIFAEHKRKVKGILHGESDTRRTSFVEPEETTELNNEVYSLEHAESREVYRILRELSAELSVHSTLLLTYHGVVGDFDFISAKAKLAIEVNGNYPILHDKAHVQLLQAFHPLLFLYNQKNKKPTVPTDIKLEESNRILVIS